MFDYEAYERGKANPDAGLLVSFHYEAIKNKKTGEYDEVPYIRIWMDKDSEVVRPVTDEDKRRFKARWEAFQEGEEQPEEGTPIKMLPFATPANIAACKAERIFTAEQLVETPDARCSRAHLVNFKYQVKDWISAQERVGYLKEIRDELERIKKENIVLKEKIAATGTEEPKKRGRPKKNGNAATDAQ